MSTWKSGESSTQYGCRATMCCNGRSLHLLIRPVGRPPKRPVILYDDLLVSCRELGPRSACGGEGGVA